MKAFRVAANLILSLLLFICLLAMGAAVTASATVLNPTFVTSQMDRLDIISLFNETAVPELQNNDDLAANPEVITSIQSAVKDNEPALKGAAEKTVADVYDYLLHGGTLDVKSALKTGVLDPALAVSIINRVDFSPFIRRLLIENIPEINIGGQALNPTPYLGAADAVIQPYFKEQIALLIPEYYDYLLGDNPALTLNIPVGPVLDKVRSALKTAVLASPPAVLADLSPALLSLGFDMAWETALPQIPSTVDITDETGLNAPGPLTTQIDDAQHGLQDARRGIIYYQEAFWVLCALTLLIMLAIALVNRNIKITYRLLGMNFAVYGIAGGAGVLIARGAVHSKLASISGVPTALQPWLTQLSDAAMKPLLIFAVSFAAAGIILLAVSLIYPGRTQPPAGI